MCAYRDMCVFIHRFMCADVQIYIYRYLFGKGFFFSASLLCFFSLSLAQIFYFVCFFKWTFLF